MKNPSLSYVDLRWLPKALPTFRWALWHKLVGFALIVALPVAVFAYVAILNNAEEARRQIDNANVATARAFASDIDHFIATIKVLLTVVAKAPEVRTAGSESTSEYLASVLSLHPYLKDIYATRFDGSTFASASEFMDKVNPDSQRYLQKALFTGEPAISGRLTAPRSKEPEILVAVPIKDSSGRGAGVVAATISLKEFWKNVPRMRSVGENTFIVVDSGGFVLVPPEISASKEEVNLRNLDVVQSALAGHTGIASYQSPWDNQSRLGAYTPLREAPFAIVVNQAEPDIYETSRTILLQGLMLFTLVTAVALLLAVFLARRLSEPLQQLAAKMRAVSQGELYQRMGATTRDKDLQALFTSFDSMAASLESRVAEIHRARQEIANTVSQLRQLQSRNRKVTENTRKSLANDLHDSVMPMITGALYEAETARQYLLVDYTAAQDKIAELRKLLDQVYTEIRQVVFDLRPPTLDKLGLVAALRLYLESYEHTTGIQARLVAPPILSRLNEAVEITTYRIVQEALNNVRKHSGASRVSVILRLLPGTLRLMVQDNGDGFDVAETREHQDGHIGLMSMTERARDIGGWVTVESHRGRGTRIAVELPLEGAEIPMEC